MPTTASSAASVTSAFSCCTRREIGITLRANMNVRIATNGIAQIAIAASFTLTRNSTTLMPTIIISDCAPWVRPQPMK